MTTTQQGPQPEFSIQRLYIKDASFESPQAPAIFQENLQPSIEINLHTSSSTLVQDIYEVVIEATITATADQKTVFLVELKQAGVFMIKNISHEQLPIILGVTCPTILFPYLRETVSNLVAQGGFQHFYLNPINFEALYYQNLQKQKTQQHHSDDTQQSH